MATTSTRLRPLAFGITCALTVAIVYALCAAVWTAWREPSLDFLNALFHGLDFRKLQAPDSRFGWGAVLLPLGVLGTWAFFTGMIFAALANRLRVRG